MKATKLYESLFILHKCQLNIHRLDNLIGLSKGIINADHDDALLLTYHINLEAVSYLDEYNVNFLKNVEPNYSERVRQVRKISAPILKRINKWKDLEKFRNNIIAHPWRDKGKFIVPNSGTYNVPRSWFEIAVFINLLKYAWSMVRIEFEEELEQAIDYVRTLQVPPPPPADYSGLNQDHLSMAAEVHKICKSLNKNYYLKVLQYSLEDQDQ
jgi:hypothetical protein